MLHWTTGVHTIAYAFPGVKIVTSAVDPEINEKFHVMPGIGNFGDRFAPSVLMFVFSQCYPYSDTSARSPRCSTTLKVKILSVSRKWKNST